MSEVKEVVLWRIVLEGEVYRCVKYDGHPNQEASGHVGGVRLEELKGRPDGTAFWHQIAGEVFSPTDAGSNELAPLFGSWDEVVSAYPRLVMPETFRSKASMDEFIEDWRKRVVDRYLDRASESQGKYWNPMRAQLARERTKQLRNKLRELLSEIEALLGDE
jgi:hypothetical protein